MQIKTSFLIVIVVILIGCTTEKSQLNGNWELVSYQAIADGETTFTIPGNIVGEQLKSWSNTTCLFVGQFEDNNRITPNFGSGTYTLNGSHYEELIEIHSSKLYIGTKVKLLIEFKGDTLIQVLPVSDDWTVDKDNCRIEKYVRVE